MQVHRRLVLLQHVLDNEQILLTSRRRAYSTTQLALVHKIKLFKTYDDVVTTRNDYDDDDCDDGNVNSNVDDRKRHVSNCFTVPYSPIYRGNSNVILSIKPKRNVLCCFSMQTKDSQTVIFICMITFSAFIMQVNTTNLYSSNIIFIYICCLYIYIDLCSIYI